MSLSANDVFDTILGGEGGQSPRNPQDFGGGNDGPGTCVVGADSGATYSERRAFVGHRGGVEPSLIPHVSSRLRSKIWCCAFRISRNPRQVPTSIVSSLSAITIVTLILEAYVCRSAQDIHP